MKQPDVHKLFLLWVVMMGITFFLCVGCDHQPRSSPNAPPILPMFPLSGHLDAKGDLEGFTAVGEWHYSWPHDEIPLWVPAGLHPTTGPFDDTAPNMGQTLDNWGRAVTLVSVSGTELNIWYAHNLDRKAVGEIPAGTEKWTAWSSLVFSRIDKWADVAVAAPQGSEVAASRHLYFVFRMGDHLFRIEATGKDPAQTFEDGLNYVDAIYKFRTRFARRAATQPRDEPPGRILAPLEPASTTQPR
jgi:hypothetical protein